MGKRARQGEVAFGMSQPGKRNRAPAHPGSNAFQEARQHLPRGPTSIQELFDWPSQFAKDILDKKHAGHSARQHCLSSNLCGGILIHSDHSGTGNGERSAIEVLRALGEPVSAWNARGLLYCGPLLRCAIGLVDLF